MAVDTIYLGHDNTVDLILKVNNVAYDLSDITSITATFGDLTLTSTNKATGTIRWDQDGYDTGEIRLVMGGQSIPAGKYSVPIVTYDAVNTTGIVWGKYRIEVKAEVEAS